MFMVLPAAIEPAAFSMAVKLVVVPPPFTVTVLLFIAVLAPSAPLINMPRNCTGWFTPPPLLLLIVL